MFLPNVLMASLVGERLTFFGRVFDLESNPETGMWYLFITIYILSIIVYNLGFARKVRLWQNVVIYIVMFIGCLILTFFGAFLPVAESLIVAAIVLALYRIRLHQERKAGNVGNYEKKQ